MATRLYYCPKCNPELDSTQLDTGCLDCGGVGHLEAEADAGLIPYAASKRPVWTWGRGAYIASTPDPLVEMARCRSVGARWRSVAYANARRIAMFPVVSKLRRCQTNVAMQRMLEMAARCVELTRRAA